MREGAPPPAIETHWALGARLTLWLAVVFILLNLVHLAYQFTIPSPGWAGPSPEDLYETESYFQVDTNAVGNPSPLQSGDLIYSIEGISAKQILTISDLSEMLIPPGWRVGGEAKMTVLRNEQTIQLEVPLTHWTAGAWLRTNFGNYSELWSWLVTLLLFGAGTFTFLNRPGNLAARFLFAFGLSNFSITLASSIPDYVGIWMNPLVLITNAFFGNIIFAYLLAPSFLGFALSFPHPKKFIERRSALLVLPYLVGSVTIFLLFLAPEFTEIGFLLTFVMLLLGVAALVHSGLTMRDAISRAQMRWAVGGVIAGAAVFMLNFASNAPPPYREVILFVASLGFPIIGLSLAMAILRYRLFDIDVIIRKTLQYALLTGLLALVYFGSVILLQSLTENLFGEQSPLVIVLSTLAIAALFNPLRTRIQDFIDRRFYRKKYNAEQALAQFAATARDEVDMDQLNAALLKVVDETMQPESVCLWLSQRGQS